MKLCISICLAIGAATAAFADRLVVHEWGTFTALQDDDGAAIGAINADDEPAPWFVHRNGGVQTDSANVGLTPRFNSKGFSPCHPDVTLRLETPVLYFYPAVASRQAPVDVKVTFHGGWLSEFYPWAKTSPTQLPQPDVGPVSITADTNCTLSWNGLDLATEGEPRQTSDPVWTAPRAVGSALVSHRLAPEDALQARLPAGKNEAPEKFLFYRGVGHLDSPLRVSRTAAGDTLHIRANQAGLTGDAARVPAAWLVEIREDGACAFCAAGPFDLAAPGDLATIPAGFPANEFSETRLDALRAAMAKALAADGLFADEAAAMLKTWELSYFRSPGRRLFYLLPHAWTERVLPLTVGCPADVTRVMVGRIELVTPDQRARLARLAAGPCPDLAALQKQYYASVDLRMAALQKLPSPPEGSDEAASRWTSPSFAQLGITPPALYQDYLALGRFRSALVLRERQRRPTPALAEFVKSNELSFQRE